MGDTLPHKDIKSVESPPLEYSELTNVATSTVETSQKLADRLILEIGHLKREGMSELATDI
jgi:hypothetical protein